MIRLMKRALLFLYGLYAWSSFLVLGTVALLLLLVTPGLRARRTTSALCARLWLALVGIRVEFRGSELLPQVPSVIVANHSSYVDGVLLKAVLPYRFSFVIKKEMVNVPLAGLLLRRIGAEFVDRFNRHSGGMDARRLMRAASSGGSLVFFPEGTFSNQPGLARFQGGAFTIAARSRMPVAPVVIRGARRILPGDSFWLHPGTVSIEVLPAVDPYETATAQPSGGLAALLRDQSRQRILAALGEPDLADSDGIANLAKQRAGASNA
jgi:1-acyl-sn-glycerol-3-phosphate acyltransferase